MRKAMPLVMRILLSLPPLAAAQQNAAPSLGAIETMISAGQLDHALIRLHAAEAATPRDARLWTLEGVVHAMQHNDAAALKAFDHALHIAPDLEAALRGEVQIYSRTEDARALPLLAKIIRTDPNDATAHEMLALLESKAGDCPHAEADFAASGEAINAHPRSLELYGGCLGRTGDYEKAIPLFERLTALHPEADSAKYDLAVVLVQAKRSKEALAVLSPLLTKPNVDPDVLSIASEAYEASGDTPRAVATLRQAIVERPDDPDYYTSFAVLCLDHESFQVGIDMLSIGLRKIPHDPALFISRGLLYAQVAAYDKAEADFKTAEQMDTAQSVSAYAMDLTALQQNSPELALERVRQQLKAHPESGLLHYILAKLLTSQPSSGDGDEATKRNAEATREAEQALKLKPDLLEARDLLANLDAQAGHYDLAAEQCRLALAANPEDQMAIYHLIVALRHEGKPEERAEIPGLVKHLAELQKISRQQETDRKRFHFEEQAGPAQ